MGEISLQRSPQVCQRLGQCRSTLHNDVRNGLLPPPIQIGSRWSAWPSDEVDAILRARIAGRSKDQQRELVRELVAKRQSAAPSRIAQLDDDEPQAAVPKLKEPKPKATRRVIKATQPPLEG
jgi:prophage regulatory protein